MLVLQSIMTAYRKKNNMGEKSIIHFYYTNWQLEIIPLNQVRQIIGDNQWHLIYISVIAQVILPFGSIIIILINITTSVCLYNLAAQEL